MMKRTRRPDWEWNNRETRVNCRNESRVQSADQKSWNNSRKGIADRLMRRKNRNAKVRFRHQKASKNQRAQSKTQGWRGFD